MVYLFVFTCSLVNPLKNQYISVSDGWTIFEPPGGLPSDDLGRFSFGGCIGDRCAVWKPQSDGLGASAVDVIPRLLRVNLGLLAAWRFIVQFCYRGHASK